MLTSLVREESGQREVPITGDSSTAAQLCAKTTLREKRDQQSSAEEACGLHLSWTHDIIRQTDRGGLLVPRGSRALQPQTAAPPIESGKLEHRPRQHGAARLRLLAGGSRVSGTLCSHEQPHLLICRLRTCVKKTGCASKRQEDGMGAYGYMSSRERCGIETGAA